MLSYKDFQSIAGYTHSVDQLSTVLKDVKQKEFVHTKAQKKRLQRYTGGEYSEDNFIEFEEVPVVTPTGDSLFEKISFKIQPGYHTIIVGPNGCGKSTLFRILSELWPLPGGKLVKPKLEEIFYIPQVYFCLSFIQKPYLPWGTLRDQIIYPHNTKQFYATGKEDQYLIELLKIVDIDIVRTREKEGLEAVREWYDVLSGGEKQRIAFARLFYHRPKYAILGMYNLTNLQP